ncbi:MAG: PEP-CTERM sorting domain-containing protein [Phycisphaerales bacterium]|nr:PEP-CTERM sorting domain-containing protein [Phycisphaerales bacterium]
MLNRFAGAGLAIAAASIGLVTNASAAYQVTSRTSEVRKISEDNLNPPAIPNQLLGSTNTLDPFSVPRPFTSKFYQSSSLSATGATYVSTTDAQGSRQGPAGSGYSGYYTTSSFQFTFTLTSAANFTLVGSLQRIWSGSVLLKLDSLTAGSIYNRSVAATNNLDVNFAPTLVNWSGLLPAGDYRISIMDRGERASPGVPGQGTESSFTFVIPAPTTAAPMLALGVFVARRRRRSDQH